MLCGLALAGLPLRFAEAVAGLSLEQALRETLDGNPDLLVLRDDRRVSWAAWWAAQRLPAALNPTVSVQVSPWTFDPQTGEPLKTILTLTWLQPVEINGAQQYRVAQARAEYGLAQWQFLAAQFHALTDTFRLYETAVYRRERYQLAEKLATFQRELVETTRRRVESGLTTSADLLLTETEAQAVEQSLRLSREEYSAATAALQNHLALPETAVPLEVRDPFLLPESVPDEESLLPKILSCHPDILSVQAQVSAAQAAWRLSRAERIPPVNVGPIYEHNESGATFYGFAVESSVPLFNTGREIAYRREMEYRRELTRLEQQRRQIRVRLQVALERLRHAEAQCADARRARAAMEASISKMQALYQAGEANLLTLLDVRRRLLEAGYNELEIMWNLTQVYADFLEATGGAGLLEEAPDATSDR
ncbi:hypothetical protein JCM17478_26910 [Thermopirellula anaerolimosa]